MSEVLERLRALLFRRREERELDEELRFHVERATEEHVRRGLDPREARRRALIELGGVERTKEDVREARGVGLLEDLVRDVRYAGRTLRRSPGFTAAAVLVLALGIGANTAVFSVVEGVLLRSLPYAHPERVVRILGRSTNGRSDRTTISLPNFTDWREQNTVFSSMAAYDEWQPILNGRDGAERIAAASVSAPFFQVLGVEPDVGRFFLPDEDGPGAARSVVLSHAFWESRYGGDPSAVGRTIELSGEPYTIVGVTPAGFEDPRLSESSSPPVLWRSTPAYFVPSSMARDGRSLTAVARLAPGVSLEEASAQMDAIMARLVDEYPQENADRGVRLQSLKEDMVGPVRPALLLLLGGALLVLLVACANLASLLLGRSAGREREMAVRRALGASSRRLVAQLLTESALLGVAGAAVGLALAYEATPVLLRLGAASLPRAGRISVDGRVLLFAVVVTVLACVLFGLSPALRAVRHDVASGLGAEARAGTSGRSGVRSRRILVGAETALTVVLLAGAGLLVRSLWRLQHTDPGLRPGSVLTLSLSPPEDRYDSLPKVRALYRSLEERLSALPGVEGVGTTDILPMNGSFDGQGVQPLDRPAPGPGRRLSAELRVITPGYLGTMGIPVVRGRGITEADRADAPAVVLINQAMARAFWPGEDPLGRRIRVYGARVAEIVGIVGDVRQFDLARAPDPEMYFPHAQAGWIWRSTDMDVVVRTARDPLALAPAARAAVREVDPSIAVSDVRTMRSVVDATMRQPRFRTTLLVVFALVALALGVVGVYGVVAYAVSRRTRELGIRIALGARPRAVEAMVVRQGLGPVLVGLAVGVVGALLLGRVISGLLYGIDAYDPATLAAVSALLAVSALVAAWIPARRAILAHPVDALRAE